MSHTPDAPAGGRGAGKATFDACAEQGTPLKTVRGLLKANKPEDFDCPDCADPGCSRSFGPDSCEQGQKANAWEMTPRRADTAFIAAHKLSDLRGWSLRDLDAADPMLAASAKREAIDDAVAAVRERAISLSTVVSAHNGIA